MIPTYPISNIAKKVGVRMSKEAVDELIYFLDEFSKKLARSSIDLAEFAQRNTVMKRDVEFAFRRMKL